MSTGQATVSSPSVADLLLAWDQRRPRTRQRDLGMSEIGVCRRRAAYRLALAEPSNPGGSLQAVMGTAIHAAVVQVYREMQAAGLLPAEDLIEHEVRFAGIKGHLDRYVAAEACLEDIKTTTSRWLSHLRVHGPTRAHLWQVSLYAAALITEGREVRQLRITYLTRDTGEQWTWTGPFDPSVVEDALGWLGEVTSGPVEHMARDHEPDSAHCQHCPFLRDCWGEPGYKDPRVVLYLEDPDARKWAERLAKAREDKRDADRREREAKGALDAIRPDHDGVPVEIDGLPFGLRWRTVVSTRLDTTKVREEYAKAGATPPTLTSTSTYLDLVPVGGEGQ